jgi:hypothetical protein
VTLDEGLVTLTFAEKFNADQVEKARAEIEPLISSALGRPTRLALKVESQAGREGDDADRRIRETEARQHPMIRRAQDLFGAPLKEIKT